MAFEMFSALPPGLQQLLQGPANAVQTSLQPEGAQNDPRDLNNRIPIDNFFIEENDGGREA